MTDFVPPESIEPGSAPGREVVRLYAATGRLVDQLVIPADPGTPDIREASLSAADRDAGPVTVAAYDGDTGARTVVASAPWDEFPGEWFEYRWLA